MADVKEFKYSVKMSCGGCSGAVKKALIKNTVDEKDIAIDMEAQTVTVANSDGLLQDEVEKYKAEGNDAQDISKFKHDKLLEIIKKTGKEASVFVDKEATAD
ncbi:hypothetical protein LPJ70_000067 [Coemansia sp. RSA 2708]|nr:hypothetical protein LPJ70_000067 [Coemansia sp. RSA 2708]